MTTKEYVAAQKEWLKANRIHDGDEVKVFRSAENYEDGWGDVWTNEMDSCVGLIGTVSTNYANPENGIRVVFDNHDSWYFPYFVLDPTLKQGVVKPVTDDAVIHLLAKWLSRYHDCPCRAYCEYAYDMGEDEVCCMFPADECPHDYVDANDNREFERRVKRYIRDHNDVEDTPCAHGMKIFCPAKHMGAPFLGCAKWCMLREARLHVEREMEKEGGRNID